MPIDLDQLNFDISTIVEDSQRSNLSPYSSQFTVGGSQQSIRGLQIPGPSSSLIGGPVGGFGGGFSVRGDFGAGLRRGERLHLEDDLDIAVDDDGTMRFSDAPRRQPAAPSGRVDRTDFGSVSSRVRHEHEGGRLDADVVSCIHHSLYMSLG